MPLIYYQHIDDGSIAKVIESYNGYIEYIHHNSFTTERIEKFNQKYRLYADPNAEFIYELNETKHNIAQLAVKWPQLDNLVNLIEGIINHEPHSITQ